MRGLIIAIFLAAVFSSMAIDVILDPGHGGTDAGASGPSYLEKTANLDVAFEAKSYLETASVTVGMTRSTDMTLSLADRCAIANSGGWERFISIHENAFDATVQGTETFCYTSGSSESFDMRNEVHPELIWAHGYYNRGTKVANFYVLVNTTMPSILGEGTFIDYTAGWDESWRYSTNWNDHKGRQGFAYAKGFCDHRGITPPTYGSPPPETDSIIVDNGDPEFTNGGSWTAGSYSGGWEGDYIFCDVTGDNWARWTPDLPDDGEYDVYMWWLAGANRCDSVFVRVNGLANDSMVVSQKGTGSEWHYLGCHEFYAGTSGYVSLGDRTAVNGDVVIADAVLWIYNAPLGAEEFVAPAKPGKMEISAWPNPFNASITINIDYRSESRSVEQIGSGPAGVGADFTPASVEIYDVSGRKIADAEPVEAGAGRLEKDTSTGSVPSFAPLNKGGKGGSYIWRPDESLSSGVYLVRAKVGNNAKSQRVVYLK